MRMRTAVVCALALTGALEQVRTAQEVLWEASPGFRDFGAVVEANGVVLTGNITGRGSTVAFDAATGKLLWRAAGTMMSAPVTDGRTGYSVNAGAGLRAYDLRTGRVLWTVAGVDDDMPADLALADGRVFVAGAYGKLRAFDAATGRAIWEHTYYPGPGRGSCPTAPVVADGVVYYGGGEDASPGLGVFLWALDAATGAERWKFEAKPSRFDRRGRCVSRPVVADGHVAVVSDNVLYALDAGTGAPRWRQDVVRTVDGREYEWHLSPPLIVGGRVYAIVQDALLGWDLQSGRPDFTFRGNFPSQDKIRKLAAADGLLYFTANLETPAATSNRQGFLYAFDPASGRVRWTHRVNRERPYVNEWGTTHFHLATDGIYYENESILVKVRPVAHP